MILLISYHTLLETNIFINIYLYVIYLFYKICRYLNAINQYKKNESFTSFSLLRVNTLVTYFDMCITDT